MMLIIILLFSEFCKYVVGEAKKLMANVKVGTIISPRSQQSVVQ